jgi:hypothetical protein
LNDDTALVEELYYLCYSRPPSKDEIAIGTKHLTKSTDRKKQLEDLAWALMNTLEFGTNH